MYVERERNAEYQRQIDEYLGKISDAKVSLESDHYQKGIYVLCDIDSKKTEQRRGLENKVAELKRSLVLKGAKQFDCHEAYPRYSLGIREFKIERVSIV